LNGFLDRSLALLFVNFRKAFDIVELSAILKALEECRIYHKYSNIIRNICEKAIITVYLHTTMKRIEIKRGVRYGNVMSPKLFTMVLAYAFKMLDWDNRGINIEGEKFNQLSFANNIVLISDNLQDVREMFYELQVTQKVVLKINDNKIKIMLNLVPSEEVIIENTIEIVEKYIYFGHEN